MSAKFDPLPEQVSLPLAGKGGDRRLQTLASLMLALGVMLVVTGGFTQVFGDARLAAIATGLAVGVAAAFVLSGFGSARLLLDVEGFEYRVGSKSWRRAWTDCKQINVSPASAGGYVMIDWKQAMPTMAPMNDRPTQRDGFTTSFGLKPRELADLMIRFRERGVGKR